MIWPWIRVLHPHPTSFTYNSEFSKYSVLCFSIDGSMCVKISVRITNIYDYIHCKNQCSFSNILSGFIDYTKFMY